MDEIVDVVNEKDEVIGKEWKKKCHSEGIWHRVAAVLLFDSKGRMWLQTRTEKKTHDGRNLDFSASGHIISGDDYYQGAKKEMNEELGVDVDLKDINLKIFEDYVYSKESKPKYVKHVIKLFVGNHEGPFNIQKEELDSIQFYTLEEVKKLMEQNPSIMTEGLRLTLKEYFKLKWD